MPQIIKAALAGFLAVTAGAGAALAQPRIPTHVACVGDSITAGTGASSTAKNYPGDLQALFGSSVKVSNFGHSGATMLSTGNTPYIKQSEYTSATTFVSGAGANAVVDVIIMLGTNDSKPVNWNASGGGTQANQFMTDCGKLIDHFAGLATHPAIYLALPPTAFTNSYTIDGTVIKDQIIPVLKQVAMQKGLATIDIQTPTASLPKDFGDGVHPNDTGYVLVAQVMHDGLLRVSTTTVGAAGAGGGGGAGVAGAGGRAAGGTSGAGGGSSTGGNSGSGGTSSTGGSPGAGGSAEGGVSGGTGGSVTGGVATGGISGTGGVSATGGQLGSTGGSAGAGTGGTPESNGSSGCSCGVRRQRATLTTTVLALFALALAFSRKRRR